MFFDNQLNNNKNISKVNITMFADDGNQADKIIFESSGECKVACQAKNYEFGECMWPEKEAGIQHYRLGICVIDEEDKHCGGTSCGCFCYNSDTSKVEH